MTDTGDGLPRSVFMVGIKGTGMAALAALLQQSGVAVCGSDTGGYFATEILLKAHGIQWVETDSPQNLAGNIDHLVYSSAYSPETHPQIAEGLKRGLPVSSYNQFLGTLSKTVSCSCCISGTHGKTTTAALTDHLLRCCQESVYAIYGSAPVGGEGVKHPGTPTLQADTGIFEACEFRRHFLLLYPDILVVTNIDYDHPDTYADRSAAYASFKELTCRISAGGYLVYCADDADASRLGREAAALRPDLHAVPYGEKAAGCFSLSGIFPEQGRTRFVIGHSGKTAELLIPGRHTALNAVGATAAAACVISRRRKLSLQQAAELVIGQGAEHLKDFSGLSRRCEKVAELHGILILDDYAHHPVEIAATMAGLRQFFPGRRIIADFMPHTYSRTAALMDDFARALSAADAIIVHPIFPSAREAGYDGVAAGRKLADLIAGPPVWYVTTHLEAAELAFSLLRRGDLFITLGAGSNREAGNLLHELLRLQQ